MGTAVFRIIEWFKLKGTSGSDLAQQQVKDDPVPMLGLLFSPCLAEFSTSLKDFKIFLRDRNNWQPSQSVSFFLWKIFSLIHFVLFCLILSLFLSVTASLTAHLISKHTNCLAIFRWDKHRFLSLLLLQCLSCNRRPAKFLWFSVPSQEIHKQPRIISSWTGLLCAF